MRCKNCGWPNEDGVSRCVKCNAPLQGSMIDSNRQQSVSSSTDEPLNATLREPSSAGGFAPMDANDTNSCPQCGYPIGAGMNECPICHAAMKSQGQSGNMPSNNGGYSPNRNVVGGNANRGNGFSSKGGTINPWATPTEDSFCTLRRINWQNEHVCYEPVSYSGQTIVLNRSNTDTNNNSITSKEQAIISHENGEWYIENKSELQTTLIRVDRKLKLEDGDVIVLGNRMFEFKKG